MRKALVIGGGACALAFLAWWMTRGGNLDMRAVAGTWELDPERSEFRSPAEREATVKAWSGHHLAITADAVAFDDGTSQAVTVDSASPERLWLHVGQTRVTLTPVDDRLMWYDDRQLLILRRSPAN